MYKSVFLEERISLNPSDITKKEVSHDLNALIVERLRKRIESRCIASGYVKPHSLDMLHRSMGTAENGRFTGNYIFYVKLRCKVFHPETDTPVECKVVKVNKMGGYVVFDEAMRVLLPRDLHIGNVDFDSLNPDDTVSIRILRSRFQTNDPFISAVGLFISRTKKAKPVAQKKAAAEEEEEDAMPDIVVGELPEAVVTEEEEEEEEAPAPVATRATRAAVAAKPVPVAAEEEKEAPVATRATRAATRAATKAAVAAAPAIAAPAIAAPAVAAPAPVTVAPAATAAKPTRRRKVVVSDEPEPPQAVAPQAVAPQVVAPQVAAQPVAAAPQPVAAAAPQPAGVATRTRARR